MISNATFEAVIETEKTLITISNDNVIPIMAIIVVLLLIVIICAYKLI